jgi:hypothetical protein
MSWAGIYLTTRFACPVGSCDIALEWTQQKTLLAKVLLLHDIAIGTDHIENTIPSATSIGYIVRRDVFHCYITVYYAIA